MTYNTHRLTGKRPGEPQSAGDSAARRKRAMASVLAPHRTNRRSSMIDKVKRFFSKGDTSVESVDTYRKKGLQRPEHGRRVVSAAQVPGGFFNGDTSGISLSSVRTSGKNTQKDVPPSIAEASMDLSDVSVSSNARLASFFAHKGDAPLSAMEMEGVLSLMKQARAEDAAESTNAGPDLTANDAPEHGNDHDHPAESSVLTNRRRALLRNTSSSSMQLPPRFTPRYESSNASNRSVSFAGSAVSTTSTARRVFDYTSLPAPYKASVFRYHSAATAPTTKTVHKKAPKQAAKRVSNTASALLSLLSESQKNSKSAASLANPYAGRVPRVSRAVETAVEEPKTEEKDGEKEDEEEKDEKEEEPKAEEAQPQEVKPKDTTKADAPIFLPKRQTKPETTENPAASATTAQPFDQYKPVRSSSLRSAVTTQEPVVPKPAVPKPVAQEPATPKPTVLNPIISKPVAPKPTVPKPLFSLAKPTVPTPVPVAKETTHIPPVSASTAVETSSFTFDAPAPSHIEPSSVSDTSVERYTTLFSF